MTQPNWAVEGRIKEAAAAAGVRVDCLDDVVERYRAGLFDEQSLPAKLQEWRDTPGHHFFAVSGADMQAEARAAFGEERTLTAQGEFVKKHGVAKANGVAEQFGTSLGGKPGTTPAHIKPKESNGKDHASNNPFLKLRNADGSINPKIAAEVAGMTKALGTKKVEAIARAAGKTVSGLPLRAA